VIELKRAKARLIALDVAGEQTYFPGMVNLSGTLCYMNSVLQVRSPSSA